MKKTFIAFIIGLGIFSGIFLINSQISAQKAELTTNSSEVSSSKEITLTSTLLALANAINNFANALKPVPEVIEPVTKSITYDEYINPMCIEGLQNEPTSSEFKDADWDGLHFIFNGFTAKENEKFIDINGDGLVDYLSEYRRSGISYLTGEYVSADGTTKKYRSGEICLLLNTGNNFEPAYRCKTLRTSPTDPTPIFQGDCADI